MKVRDGEEMEGKDKEDCGIDGEEREKMNLRETTRRGER